MSEVTVGKAVMSLRPGAIFVMSGDDVENITWRTDGVTPLTPAEVEAEVARLEQAAVDEAAQREADRASAMEKLAALGLTESEAAAVFNG
jgi:hypothetical protein